MVMVGKFLFVLRSPAGADTASSGEEDELGGLPTIERHLHDSLIIDDLSDASVLVSTSDVFAVTVICSLIAPTASVTLISGFDPT